MKTLKSPFPYFGGKSRVADLVWSRLGDVDNFVEPFAGTIATLLRRPKTGKIETVNDRNHFICNFWRAVQSDPEAVAQYADSPVSEADLHARHAWLMRQEFVGPLADDPDWFDSRIAGWWVWGQCCWIGAGWCDQLRTVNTKNMPEIDSRGSRGVHGSHKKPITALGNSAFLPGVHGQSKQLPDLAGDSDAFGRGVAASAGHNKRPVLRSDCETRGVASLGRPQLGDAYDIGRGVNSNGSAGTCKERREWLTDWLQRLSDRLRLVRVCYGDWHRICDSKTTMDRLGTTGAFLDPPYAKNIKRVQSLIRGEEVATANASNRANDLYAGDKSQDIDQLVADVNKWCQRWGQKKTVRIALCGYEGEHDNLEKMNWTVESWKAQGGYANRNADNKNKNRERIWFSPACLADEQGSLFDEVAS